MSVESQLENDLVVEPMQEAHIPQVLAIEAASFPRTWPNDSFENELRNNRVARYLVARAGDLVVGYAGLWLILDEAHITTIAVDPAWRGRRVGKRLLWHMLDMCRRSGCRWSVLEVRDSNQVAQAMYRHFGFKRVGTRKGYYDHEDDAAVMWLGNMQSAQFGDLLESSAPQWRSEP